MKGELIVFQENKGEYTDIILHLREKARQRMCRWIEKFRRDKIRAP